MEKVKKIIYGLGGLCLFGATLTGFPLGKIKSTAETGKPLYSMEEMLTPVWEGNTAYMESVFPVENENGVIEPIDLMYPIDEIVEVKNALLTETYQEGVDYAVSKGRLIIAEDGAIPITSYEEFHPSTSEIKDVSGGNLCFHEGSWFHERQIVVTYKHSENYKGYVPEGKAELLSNFYKKVESKEAIDLLVFGDSISVGANTSGFSEINVSPWLPTYAELFGKTLASKYGVTVNLTNPSVGGKTSDWGIEQIDGVLAKQTDLDLAVVAFGMNDPKLSPEVYAEKINVIVGKIKQSYPDADVLLIAPMLPNAMAKGFFGNQWKFYEALMSDCEKEGVAVANVTRVHASLLQRKRYEDMTGNNVNHPNDYLTRVYVQTLMATLSEKLEEMPNTDVPTSEESSSSEADGEKNNPLQTLLSGCGAAVSGVAVSATTLAGAAMALKKKKE